MEVVEHGISEQHGNVDEHGAAEERVMPPKVSSRPEAATLFPGPSRQASAARGDGRESANASESASARETRAPKRPRPAP